MVSLLAFSWFMGHVMFWKFSKLQITRSHKSRNERASPFDFYLLDSQNYSIAVPIATYVLHSI